MAPNNYHPPAMDLVNAKKEFQKVMHSMYNKLKNGRLDIENDDISHAIENQIKKAVYMGLTQITSGKGYLGRFHRSTLWIKNPNRDYLQGYLGKGPYDYSDLAQWNGSEEKSLDDELNEFDPSTATENRLSKTINNMIIPLSDYEKNVLKSDNHDLHFIDKEFFKKLFQDKGMATNGVVGVITMHGYDGVVGAVTVEYMDDYLDGKKLTHDDLVLLMDYTSEIGHFIETARLIETNIVTQTAHLIRNPTTSIGGFARRLAKTKDPEKIKEYAGIIVSEVDRLEKLLQQKGISKNHLIN